MPCSDNYPPEPLTKTEDTSSYKLLLERSNKATRLLCYLCKRTIEMQGGLPTKELREWYNEHEKEDEKRILSSIVSKLTPEEKELLTKLQNKKL